MAISSKLVIEGLFETDLVCDHSVVRSIVAYDRVVTDWNLP